MSLTPETICRVRECINTGRLLQTAVQLIEIPSPTRSAAAVANLLEQILRNDGFEVERVEAGWPDAPAVVSRWSGQRPGRTLQFNGHLDTVHLPFVPPRVEAGILYGSKPPHSKMKPNLRSTTFQNPSHCPPCTKSVS